MTRIFSVLLTALVVVSLATGGAVAQESNTTNASAPAADTGDYEQIDNATYLVGSSVDLDTETASITLYSEIPQEVTISDAGAFVEGGEVPQRTVYLKPGEKTTVEMPITVADQQLGQQYAGVSITTAKTLYAEPLETSSPLIGGPWTYQDVQLVAVTVAATTSTIVIVMLLRSRFDLDAEPERIA